MPNPQRLEFITRHFNDLQTIRLAPLPIAMLLAPAWHLMPHMNRSAAWAALLAFVFAVGGFYWWSTVAIRRRYGSVRIPPNDDPRLRSPVISAIWLIMVAGMSWFFFFNRGHFVDFWIASTVLITMLMRILDSTNVTSRRITWAVGLVVLFTAGPILIGVDKGAAILCLGGSVWLSLSIFDFLLLRRTFADISANPSASFTQGELRYG